MTHQRWDDVRIAGAQALQLLHWRLEAHQGGKHTTR